MKAMRQNGKQRLPDTDVPGKAIHEVKRHTDKPGRRMALCGVLTAVSFVLGAVERLLPPLSGAVPGVKLGLANLPVLLALSLFGPSWALGVSVTRVVLGGLFFGGPIQMLHGLFGALLSLLMMVLVRRTGRFSLAGISVVGGTCHNVGQWCAAYLLTRTAGLVTLLPPLCALGAVCGLAVGMIAGLAEKRVRQAAAHKGL